MKTRVTSTSILLTRRAREIVEPLAHQLAHLNEELALIAAAVNRTNLTDAEGRDALRRAIEAHSALNRLDQQLEAALRHQPSEVCGHGHIKDVRASIVALRAKLEAVGA
jgi:hypothetical protein